MDECLAYFRDAIQHPESVAAWTDWWRTNQELVRRSFDRADYLNLKFRRLEAARAISASSNCTISEIAACRRYSSATSTVNSRRKKAKIFFLLAETFSVTWC